MTEPARGDEPGVDVLLVAAALSVALRDVAAAIDRLAEALARQKGI